MKIEDVYLGQSYKDTVTNYSGVATCKAEYLGGGHQIQITKKNSDKIDSEWIDVNRIIEI